MRSPIKPVYTSEYHMQLMNASVMNSDDCAIVISHTGITKETLQIAKQIKKMPGQAYFAYRASIL